MTVRKNKESEKGVNFFLYDSRKKLICIHKRDMGTKKWDLFGGKTENDTESQEDTLSREVFEELGIELEYRQIDTLENKKNKKTFVIHFPFYKRKLIRLDEGAGFVWLSYEDIKKLNKNENIDKEALRLLKKFKERASK